MTVPDVIPVTSPDEFTVAIAVLDDTHGEVAFAVPEPVKVVVAPTQRLRAPVIEGNAFTVTIFADEVPLHPFTSVAVTVMTLLLDTKIEAVVSPVLHK